MKSTNPLRPWTAPEQKFLIENYTLLGPVKIGEKLGRTTRSVTNRACDIRKGKFLGYGPGPRGPKPKPLIIS